MVKRVALALLICLGALACVEAATSGRLTSTAGGFSIQPLAGYQGLLMLLPASNGFAPNVNVLTQPNPGTLDDYIAVSKKQFTALGFTVLKEAKRGTAWTAEYKGRTGSYDAHWYSKAQPNGKKVYLATATALATQWPSYSAKLKACVDSLDTAR